ncbi:MAG: bifunctional demethylmenaquinone methyltransferase/2-methoxy-6-polyprenyl-1,4-benzoquinol methylase UbiE [Bacteroidales bacterium]|nr:bifunctional demethylmenaquinone methyltransferase/2-methoxy-6-polyprenyl-1,4-benzoquinol methylase UbiE [Bacteroidales bacterium]
MFNAIAGRYDFLNHFLSFGIDYNWRKILVKVLKNHNPNKILDVATGTADLAIKAAKKTSAEILGIDISKEMLEIGKKKVEKLGLQNRISLLEADAENLPFQNDSFDAVMVSFGVRNFENLDKGLEEIYRVLKPGGIFLVLEFSQPDEFPEKQLYGFYSRFILPFFGRIFSGDKRAYSYLPESVIAFPYGQSFLERMKAIGYNNLSYKKLTFGVATLYIAYKIN